MTEQLTRARIEEALARANAATEGPWDAEIGEDIEVNAQSARTQWNEAGTVGTPARSWSTVDRILEVEDAEEELDEAEYDQIAANATFTAGARSDVPAMAEALLRVLDLHEPETVEVVAHVAPRFHKEWPTAQVSVCSRCLPGDVRNMGSEADMFDVHDFLYPCPTVRAITGKEAGGDEA